MAATGGSDPEKTVTDMSRERIITNLQQAVYILNFVAVCLVAGSMALSISKIVDAMEAEMFLSPEPCS